MISCFALKIERKENIFDPFFSIKNGFKLKEMEKELILTTLAHYYENKSHAAQQLEISRKTLYEKIARYRIE